MHRHERHLEETLTKIAALASDAVNGGQSEDEEEYKEEEEEEEEGETADPGCTIKSVPNRLLVKAAETAVKINPVNGLMFGRVADLAPGLPQDPARLAVLAQKYWGPTPRRLSVSFMESTPADLRRTDHQPPERVDADGLHLVRRDAGRRPGPDLARPGRVLVVPRHRRPAHPAEPPDDEPARVHHEHARAGVRTGHPARGGAHARLPARAHAAAS